VRESRAGEKGQEREMKEKRGSGEAVEPSEKSPPYLLIDFSFICYNYYYFNPKYLK